MGDAAIAHLQPFRRKLPNHRRIDPVRGIGLSRWVWAGQVPLGQLLPLRCLQAKHQLPRLPGRCRRHQAKSGAERGGDRRRRQQGLGGSQGGRTGPIHHTIKRCGPSAQPRGQGERFLERTVALPRGRSQILQPVAHHWGHGQHRGHGRAAGAGAGAAGPRQGQGAGHPPQMQVHGAAQKMQQQGLGMGRQLNHGGLIAAGLAGGLGLAGGAAGGLGGRFEGLIEPAHGGTVAAEAIETGAIVGAFEQGLPSGGNRAIGLGHQARNCLTAGGQVQTPPRHMAPKTQIAADFVLVTPQVQGQGLQKVHRRCHGQGQSFHPPRLEQNRVLGFGGDRGGRM